MNINQLIRTGHVLTPSIPGKVCVIVLLWMFLYMFGLNILYAKLVSSMAAHAAFQLDPSACLSLC